jgi:hypothetical protein
VIGTELEGRTWMASEFAHSTAGLVTSPEMTALAVLVGMEIRRDQDLVERHDGS